MSIDWTLVLKTETVVTAVAAVLLTIWMAVDAVCRRAYPAWPVSGEWLVIGLFASLAIRFVDLAIARIMASNPNPPHTALDWALIVVFMVWVAKRRMFG